MRREQRIYEEAAALWRCLHGEAPPDGADASWILDRVLGGLPEASYGRLNTPHLRPANIAFPKR